MLEKNSKAPSACGTSAPRSVEPTLDPNHLRPRRNGSPSSCLRGTSPSAVLLSPMGASFFPKLAAEEAPLMQILLPCLGLFALTVAALIYGFMASVALVFEIRLLMARRDAREFASSTITLVLNAA